MAAIDRVASRDLKRCPVCGRQQCAVIHRMDAGALSITRVFYGCGSIVTTTGSSSGWVLVVGGDCRKRNEPPGRGF